MKQFCRGMMGALVGSGVFTPAAALRTLRHLPQAVGAAYRALWRENSIGPNLKLIAGTFLPVGAVLAVPLTVIGAFGYGCFLGAWRGALDGLPNAVGTLLGDARKADRTLADSLLPDLRDYEPDPLPKGSRPFDIRLMKLPHAILNGFMTSLVGAVLLTALSALRLPRLWWRISKAVFSEMESGLFLLSLFFWVLAHVALAVGIALLPFGSMLFSLAVGCRRTYSEGIVAAWRRVLADARSWDSMLREAVRKK